jgi:beta-xylosidase
MVMTTVMTLLMTALLGPAGIAPTADKKTINTAKNPILPNGADPHAVVVGDTVWIYPTFGLNREQAFYAFTSKNLLKWERRGPILRFADVKWINADGNRRHFAWAPCMIAHDGKYYFYYSVGDQNVTPSRIGVAVGDTPAGPFKDSGKPLINDGAKNVFEAIDPMVFTDLKDGKSYLYAGGSNGAKLRVWELGADMTSLAREVNVSTPPQFTEGAFMHERDGKYYLSYSHGGWQDASYSVHYAMGDSPAGPFEYKGAILTSDKKNKGPGHHSFISGASGQWYIVYHRWNARDGNGPYKGSRSVCIDKLDFNADGTIKPVAMTDEGIAADAFAEEK